MIFIKSFDLISFSCNCIKTFQFEKHVINEQLKEPTKLSFNKMSE